MKNSNASKIDFKSFFQKQWSNIVFFLIVLLFLIPSSRVYLQTILVSLLSTTPTLVESENRQNLTNYNLALEDLNGEIINLDQSTGRPVLINLWATWCGPCLAELPELKALYEDNKHKVDFYFISQEEPEVLKKFLKSKNYSLPVYIQKSKLPEPLLGESLPSTYLINRKGEIEAVAKRAASWNDQEIQMLIDDM